MHTGAIVRVGRTARADIAIPEDTFLSGVHFELRSDGQTCTLLDLNSSNGTTIRGSRIKQATLVAGDGFTAGHTQFAIVGDPDAVPVPAAAAPAAAPAEPLEPAAKQRLLLEMRSNLQPLYAVLDAAQNALIVALLTKYKCESASLFDTAMAPELIRFAPYIVALPPTSAVMEPLLELGWHSNWGIYLTSTANGGELIAFLRRLLISVQPDGQKALLRFYDPRVLRTLLSEAAPQQWPYFFGTVRSYLMAAEEPQTAAGFAMAEQGLMKSHIPLLGQAPTGTKAVPVQAAARPGAPRADNQLVLSEQQMTKLKDQEQNPFAEDVYAEMQKLHPDRAALLGEAGLKKLIEYGCKRPQRYGIQTEEGIRGYVSLMVQMGRDFDVNLPWAAEILGRRLPEADKLTRLAVAAGKSV